MVEIFVIKIQAEKCKLGDYIIVVTIIPTLLNFITVS